MLECAECGSEIATRGRLIIGDVLECPGCAIELEVVDVNPLTFERAADDARGLFTDEIDTSDADKTEDDEGWIQ
ncbi:MAG: hypothetical protein ACE5IK_02155 [Acidobacteriota bacterium]